MNASLLALPILRVGKGPLAGACWSTSPVQVVLSGPAVDTGLPFSGEPVPLKVTLSQGRLAQPQSTDRVQVGPDGTVRILQPAARPCVLVLGRAVAFKYRRLDLAVVPVSAATSDTFSQLRWDGQYAWQWVPDSSGRLLGFVRIQLVRLSDRRPVWQGELTDGPCPADVTEVLFATGTVLVCCDDEWSVYDLPSCDLLASFRDDSLQWGYRIRLAPTGEALYGFTDGAKGDPAQLTVRYRREGFQVPDPLLGEDIPLAARVGDLCCVSAAHEILFDNGTVWRAGDPRRSLSRACPSRPEWDGRRIVFNGRVAIV